MNTFGTIMSHFKVVVIGGGMSGLSACVKLLEAGIKDVVLLEANYRLGGRINTIQYENGFIELGAQWIHGTNHNPIYELAKSLNNLDTKENNADLMYYSTQDGQPIDKGKTDKIFEKIENIFDNLEDLIENEIDDDSDQDIRTLLDDNFHKIVNKLKLDHELADVELVKAIYKVRLNEERYESSCDNLHNLSSKGWNEFEDFNGEQFTKLKDGYHKLIEYLSSKIPSNSIKLNELVENINWTSDDFIEITSFNSAENKKHIYLSNSVLVTIPLGCLKKSHENLFYPKLPTYKINSIEKLGFGCINKIFIVFEDPILEKKVEGMQIFWKDDYIHFELDAAKKWNLKNNMFYKELDNFELMSNFQNILLCFTVGHTAIFIESLEEECLIDIFTEIFDKCFPYLNLPRPKNIFKSKWNSNKFSNGSYSFIKMGSSIKDVKNLAKPIDDRIYFAGEATTYKYIGTVHGAYISGREAANKIIKNL